MSAFRPAHSRNWLGVGVIFFGGFGGLVVFGLWVICCIDVLLTPERACRTLPKLAWVFIVLLLPLFGSIIWLLAGRPWIRGSSEYVSDRSSSRLGAPAHRTARSVPHAAPRGPDDDEEFLATLGARAEEQRRRQQDRDDDVS